jgi:hypothetical protein
VWEWSLAFPERSGLLSRWFRGVPARFSNAQKTTAGFGVSLLILLILILAFGHLNAAGVAAALVLYGLLAVRLSWIIWREGWSGKKRGV